MKYGYFINPSPTSLSDLVNDHNYMVIRDYILNVSTLKGSSAIAISDLTAGSVITKVAIKVETPFESNHATNEISVTTDSGSVLMDASWNDPSIASNYETDCFYVVNGNTNEVLVNHTLSNMTAGYAILHIEMYENISNYDTLQTQSGQDYNTADKKTVDVTVNE